MVKYQITNVWEPIALTQQEFSNLNMRKREGFIYILI